ncbi:hypothetical protein ACP275_09G048100 [Erythranthe tilingii]
MFQYYKFSLSYVCLLNMVLIFARASFLDNVCSGCKDKAFCMKVLGSDPRSPYAGYDELAEIAIELASGTATTTRPKILSLLRSAKDPQLINNFRTCNENYGNALDSLRRAPESLKRRDYLELNLEGNNVYEQVTICEEVFKNGSPIKNENYRLAQLGDIIVVIATDAR